MERGIWSRLASVLLMLGLWAMAGSAVKCGAALAQAPVNLDTLTISLWPEYDRAGVLVMYRGLVASDVRLPVSLQFRIPKSGDVGGTAGVDAQGNFHYYSRQVTDLDDGLEVTYTSPYPEFQFEYYDSALQSEGQGRIFAYTYRADAQVGALTLQAQEPAGSADFATTPDGVSAADPGSSLKVRRLTIGGAKVGDTFAWEIRYSKTDPRLSAQILGLPTPGVSNFEDAASAPQQSGLSQQTILIIAGIVAVVLLALVGLYFGVVRRQAVTPPPAVLSRRKKGHKSRRGGQPTTARPAARSSISAPTTASPRHAEAGFCHQCGSSLGPGDAFCAKCGARRKGA